jgi:hypothetical protein
VADSSQAEAGHEQPAIHWVAHEACVRGGQATAGLLRPGHCSCCRRPTKQAAPTGG